MNTEEYFELCASLGEDKAVMEALAAAETKEMAGILGYIHYLGEGGIEPDNAKAYEYLLKGEEDNDPLSLYTLALMCYDGELPETDEGPMFDWYSAEPLMERCAEQPGIMRIPALMWLGDFYMDFARGGDPDIALEYFEKAAVEGSAEALDKIASYLYDMAGARDYTDEELNASLFEAMTRLHEVSPETENYNLGYLYEHGIGTPTDIEKALQLYEADYAEGYADGAQALADYYNMKSSDPGFPHSEAERLKSIAGEWQHRAEEAEPANPEPPEIEED